jgi:hypothetical protein
LEVAAIVAIILAVTLPMQDYALREYLDWQAHPSPQTYQAFVEKQNQQQGAKLLFVAPAVAVVVVVAGVLNKYKTKKR